MGRRLLNLLTALSLLLCAAAVVFWVRSHAVGDELRYHCPPRQLEVLSNEGLVRVGWGEFVARDYSPPVGWQGSFWPFERETDYYEADLRRGTTFGIASERWMRQTPGLRADVRMVTFPYALLTLVFAFPFACIIVRRLTGRRRGRRVGLCPACGYDLRATPGQCPECGKAATTPADVSTGGIP